MYRKQTYCRLGSWALNLNCHDLIKISIYLLEVSEDNKETEDTDTSYLHRTSNLGIFAAYLFYISCYIIKSNKSRMKGR